MWRRSVPGVSGAADPDGLPPGRRGLASACIAAGITVTVLDAAMLNIALPSAAADLGLTPAEAVWIVNAYQITVVGTLIPMAALGEIFGFRRVWGWLRRRGRRWAPPCWRWRPGPRCSWPTSRWGWRHWCSG